MTKKLFERKSSVIAARTSSSEPYWKIFTPCFVNARRAATRTRGLRSRRTTLRNSASGDSTSNSPPATLNWPEPAGEPPGLVLPGSRASRRSGSGSSSMGVNPSRSRFAGRKRNDVVGRPTGGAGESRRPGGGGMGSPRPRLSDDGFDSAMAALRNSAFPAFSDSSSPWRGLIFSPSALPRRRFGREAAVAEHVVGLVFEVERTHRLAEDEVELPFLALEERRDHGVHSKVDRITEILLGKEVHIQRGQRRRGYPSPPSGG